MRTIQSLPTTSKLCANCLRKLKLKQFENEDEDELIEISNDKFNQNLEKNKLDNNVITLVSFFYI